MWHPVVIYSVNSASLTFSLRKLNYNSKHNSTSNYGGTYITEATLAAFTAAILLLPLCCLYGEPYDLISVPVVTPLLIQDSIFFRNLLCMVSCTRDKRTLILVVPACMVLCIYKSHCSIRRTGRNFGKQAPLIHWKMRYSSAQAYAYCCFKTRTVCKSGRKCMLCITYAMAIINNWTKSSALIVLVVVLNLQKCAEYAHWLNRMLFSLTSTECSC